MIQEIAAPTLIAEGSRIRGAVTFYSTTHVFGLIDGDVDSQSSDSLYIGKTGWVSGNIAAVGPVRIEGRVDGDIRSASTVHLHASANVRGRIEAPAVQILPGAFFNGELKTQSAKTEKAKPPVNLRVAPQRAAA